MCAYSLRYSAYGRTFRVERNESTGRWHAVGRVAGMGAYVLDKLGDDADQDGMQRKLDAWAKRNGCRPVNMPQAAQQTLGV